MAVKKFSMEPVLRFRKQQEDRYKHKFIKKQQEETEIFNQLQNQQKEYSRLITTLTEHQVTGISALELTRFEERIQYVRQQIEITNNELQRKQKAVEQARRALLAKTKDHKALESLKEKQNKAWKEYLDKKEATMLDEIAVLRHDRFTR